MILGIDTASEWVCVGVGDAGGVRASYTSPERMHHAELLAPIIQSCLAQAELTPAELTKIVVGVGPGPFTGLRVGLVTARTMAYALGIEVVGVCSLDVIAAEAAAAGQADEFAVATDARRKEVYFATYDANGKRAELPVVAKPADVATGLPTAGAGAALYATDFPNRIEPGAPSGEWLIAAGLGAAELLSAEPLYLRRPDAQAPGKPKAVS